MTQENRRQYSWNVLNRIRNHIQKILPKYGGKFAYALSRNKALLEQEIRHLEEQWPKQPETFQEFHQAEFQLLTKYSNLPQQALLQKAQQGMLFFHEIIPEEQMTDFKEDHKQLREQYQDTLESVAKNNKEIARLKTESIAEPTFYMIRDDIIPWDMIEDGTDIEPLIDLIDESSIENQPADQKES